MKRYEQWKEEHNIHQGYPDHEMIYNGGYIEGFLAGKATTEPESINVRALRALRVFSQLCTRPGHNPPVGCVPSPIMLAPAILEARRLVAMADGEPQT